MGIWWIVLSAKICDKAAVQVFHVRRRESRKDYIKTWVGGETHVNVYRNGLEWFLFSFGITINENYATLL
jgi:hypothetical protein